MSKRSTAAGMVVVLCATSLFLGAIFLLQQQVSIIKHVREDILPLAASLPPLEQKAKILRTQSELTEVQSQLQGNRSEEDVRTFVLPSQPDTTLILLFIESIRTFLEKRSMLKEMSPVTVDSVPQEITIPASMGNAAQNAWTQAVRFTATVTPEGREELLRMLQYSGTVTVGDALTREDIRNILSLTESENAAAIVPIEQFLSADLLTYIKDRQLFDARLDQSVPSQEFQESFRSILQHSRLHDVMTMLESDVGRTIIARKLWPMQFLTVEDESIESMPGGLERVSLTIQAYGRR
jgi:hypothetical protein